MTGSKNISSRVVLPADELAAVYNPVKRQLTLSAKGTYPLPIIQGNFLRLPWVGGLKFLLVGWTLPEGPGPEGIEFKFPYEFSSLVNLPIHPGEGLTVVDLHHPRGVRVPIRYLGLKDDTNTSKEGTPEEGNQVPEKTVQNNKTIYVVEAEPFTISAPASSADAYTYHVDNEFNPDFLTLTNSKIEGGQIVWTFTAHKLGTTEVVVSELGSVKPPAIGTWWQEQTYDVHVILRKE